MSSSKLLISATPEQRLKARCRADITDPQSGYALTGHTKWRGAETWVIVRPCQPLLYEPPARVRRSAAHWPFWRFWCF